MDQENIIKTGDILVRLGKSKALGLPIEQLIALATKSRYSHASIAIVENNKPLIFEVNQDGTKLLPLNEWLKLVDNNWAIFRINGIENKYSYILERVKYYYNKNISFDWQFSSPEKFYCTESVVRILKECGIETCEPKSPMQVLPWYIYLFIFIPLNGIALKFCKEGFPEYPIYFVGNSNNGLLSIPNLVKIYEK